MKKSNLSVFSLALIGVLMAKSATADVIVMGAGTIDCGQWLEDRAKDDYYGAMSWVQGFISSFNIYNSATSPHGEAFGSVSPQSLAAYLDKYCRDNPLNDLVDASDSFIKREK